MKVIFISVDTLRADHLGCYGYRHNTSPYIDQIASQGVVFEKAFAADVPTEVAHTDIFTGKVGLTTGVVSHGSDLSYLPKPVDWLPTMLNESGYTTAAVDNLYHLKEWFARGYRYYMNARGKRRWIDGATINKMAKTWLKEHHQEDFFLFLHYWDPHTPYLPPKKYIPEFYPEHKNPYNPANKSMEPAYNHLAYPFFKRHHFDLLGPVTDAEYVNALYDAEIRYLDDLIKELDQYLEELGIVDDTMFVLFGDHGESLTEHQIYWDHCGLYDNNVHIPMIMRFPGHIPANKRVKGFVQQVDMMPTVLDALQIDKPSKLDGKSLWPSIHGKEDGTQEKIYLSECAWQASRGLRTHDYKFIQNIDSGLFTRPPVELYDLKNDPKETVNIAEQEPSITNLLKRDLECWVDEKLQDRKDPMMEVLQKQGLPFRKRIEVILSQVGLTWDEWRKNPSREKFDALFDQKIAK
ncbi:sulfatase [Evansella sp. AB-P1]|uniref:sulfatase n=1 Tax=Evansella sp. AB-P1 TaxID=3037653 RepID=UPI00241F98C4|nr:sulfatase [Evansella sp. AB-P1]MDG5787207.1 sulfatase [Evansella sp. AB-P1]